MLDDEPDTSTTTTTDTDTPPTGTGRTATRKRRAASRPAGPPAPEPAGELAGGELAGGELTGGPEPASESEPAARTRKSAARRVTKKAPDTAGATAKKATARSRKKAAPAAAPLAPSDDAAAPVADAGESRDDAATAAPAAPVSVLFQPPEPVVTPPRRRRSSAARDRDGESLAAVDEAAGEERAPASSPSALPDRAEDEEDAEGRRRRRGGRGRRGRGRGRGEETSAEDATAAEEAAPKAQPAASADTEAGATGDDETATAETAEAAGTTSSRRRRRRRRRAGAEDAETEERGTDESVETVVRVREPRSTRSRDREPRERDGDSVRSVKGSTRLEAKKQRRREGREAGRRRPAVITEAEFLARRESVDRAMIVRQTGERTQIAVLEDDVLVEHYVSTASSGGLVGNVYLGKVQNVLPSMEAAFVDIGRGRNAVLYAGEVNWDAAGLEGQPRRIELALKSGDSVLVQVTKDPIGHKGARLTSQVSLPGRYLVFVPGGSMTGISRKLPDTERARLKSILKTIVPDGAGVIVRTAAEGATEEALSRDIARLTAQWEVIEKNAAKGNAPALLYSEPDMTIRVVRDIFNEDFDSLIVSGDEAWEILEPYLAHVAPDLRERMTRWTAEEDVFAAHRVDEQLAKALDRKVWLPSGGYLIIDRTEAMVVVDVNTGKFTGAGGNLEETVTKNNLEAAEEIVRQLRLRDLGGIIVIDFIDMVLESNRDLVLRRLLECLGRDRTKHQVAEVTSLGLVQMTRKRVGQGLHEVFAETCEACNGRGYHVHSEPVTKAAVADGNGDRRRRGSSKKTAAKEAPRPKPAPPLPAAVGNGAGGDVADSAPAAAPEVADAAAADAGLALADSDDSAEVMLLAPDGDLEAGSDEGTAPPDETAPARRRRGRRSAGSPVTTL